MKKPRRVENAAFICEYGRSGERHVAEATLSTFSEFNVDGVDSTKPFDIEVRGVKYHLIPKDMGEITH